MEVFIDSILSDPWAVALVILLTILVYHYYSIRKSFRKLKSKNRDLQRNKSRLGKKAGQLKTQLKNARRYNSVAMRRHHASVANLSVRSQVQKQRVDDLIDVLKDRSKEISILKKAGSYYKKY